MNRGRSRNRVRGWHWPSSRSPPAAAVERSRRSPTNRTWSNARHMLGDPSGPWTSARLRMTRVPRALFPSRRPWTRADRRRPRRRPQRPAPATIRPIAGCHSRSPTRAPRTCTSPRSAGAARRTQSMESTASPCRKASGGDGLRRQPGLGLRRHFPATGSGRYGRGQLVCDEDRGRSLRVRQRELPGRPRRVPGHLRVRAGRSPPGCRRGKRTLLLRNASRPSGQPGIRAAVSHQPDDHPGVRVAAGDGYGGLARHHRGRVAESGAVTRTSFGFRCVLALAMGALLTSRFS